MKNILSLKHNNFEIIFKSESYSSQISLYDDINIILIYENTEYLLSRDCFQYNLYALRDLLNEAINNNSVFPYSIKKNIGIIWNEIVQEVVSGKLQIEQELGFIEEFILWESPGNISPNVTTTWLYNDKDNIIFEVTPNYDHYMIRQEIKMDYGKFIENYASIIKVEMPKDI